jgi:hypothetical protein
MTLKLVDAYVIDAQNLREEAGEWVEEKTLICPVINPSSCKLVYRDGTQPIAETFAFKVESDCVRIVIQALRRPGKGMLKGNEGFLYLEVPADTKETPIERRDDT